MAIYHLSLRPYGIQALFDVLPYPGDFIRYFQRDSVRGDFVRRGLGYILDSSGPDGAVSRRRSRILTRAAV